MTNSERRLNLLAQGLCVCGKPIVPGIKVCSKCREYRRNYQKLHWRKYHARLKAKGRCWNCGGLPLTTKTLCERCRMLGRRHSAEQKERKTKAGICWDCNEPRTETTLRCRACGIKACEREMARRQRLNNA